MRGLSYPIYSVGAINSLLFGVYMKTLEVLSSPSTGPTYTDILLAGAVSGAAQLTLAVPVDLVKVRLQAMKGEAFGESEEAMLSCSRETETLGLSEGDLQGGRTEGML